MRPCFLLLVFFLDIYKLFYLKKNTTWEESIELNVVYTFSDLLKEIKRVKLWKIIVFCLFIKIIYFCFKIYILLVIIGLLFLGNIKLKYADKIYKALLIKIYLDSRIIKKLRLKNFLNWFFIKKISLNLICFFVWGYPIFIISFSLKWFNFLLNWFEFSDRKLSNLKSKVLIILNNSIKEIYKNI